MKTQEQNIQERIRLRKLRSDNGTIDVILGSICKFDLNGSPVQKEKLGVNNKLSDLDDLPTESRVNMLNKRAQDDTYQSQKQLTTKNWREI